MRALLSAYWSNWRLGRILLVNRFSISFDTTKEWTKSLASDFSPVFVNWMMEVIGSNWNNSRYFISILRSNLLLQDPWSHIVKILCTQDGKPLHIQGIHQWLCQGMRLWLSVLLRAASGAEELVASNQAGTIPQDYQEAPRLPNLPTLDEDTQAISLLAILPV